MLTVARSKPALSLALVLSAALALAGFARLRSEPLLVEGQILTIGAESLTTYLPDGPTAVGDVVPRAEQRGVGIDGGLRGPTPHGMAIAGNPFGVVWQGETLHNGVQLDRGSYSPWEIDIAMPAPIVWTDWYHNQHRHSGLVWMTPADVHFDPVELMRAERSGILDAAYQCHSERFVRHLPVPLALPCPVWINAPVTKAAAGAH